MGRDEADELIWGITPDRVESGDRPTVNFTPERHELDGLTRSAAAHFCCYSVTPETWAEKFESFDRISWIRERNGNFDSCNSWKRLGTSRLHELHESKFPFLSRIEFIRSKLSYCSAHFSEVSVAPSFSLYVGCGSEKFSRRLTSRHCWAIGVTYRAKQPLARQL